MSKTDKTKPFWVQIATGDIPVREVHNHENGVCEIKGMKGPDAEHVAPGTDRCYFTWEYDGKNYGCGCKMCTMQVERKQMRRRERHNKRQEVDEWMTSLE